MQTQSHVRFKKRVPCEFRDDDGHHIGMALNVSERGLFISSRTTPQVGARITLDLSSQNGPSAMGIAARVVWKRKVHREVNSLSDGGIGLEIEEGLETYAQFLRALVPEIGDVLAASEAPEQEAVAEPELPEFHVRVAHCGTPRTRFVTVRAASETDAATKAVESLGEGWQMLEVAEAGEPLDPEDSRF